MNEPVRLIVVDLHRLVAYATVDYETTDVVVVYVNLNRHVEINAYSGRQVFLVDLEHREQLAGLSFAGGIPQDELLVFGEVKMKEADNARGTPQSAKKRSISPNTSSGCSSAR